MTRAELFVAAARQLVNKARWRHRGRQPWAVDCIGLLVLSGRPAGLIVEDEPNYGREPWDDQLRKGCRRRFGAPLPADQAAPGDIAVIQWRREEPSHIGIIGNHPDGGLTLIHSHNLKGVIEQGLTGHVATAVLEVYRPWGEP